MTKELRITMRAMRLRKKSEELINKLPEELRESSRAIIDMTATSVPMTADEYVNKLSEMMLQQIVPAT